jgi:L-amino acid N-acyltransferase YncA
MDDESMTTPTYIRFTADDGDALAAIYAPAVALPTSFELEPPDAAEMTRRAEAILPKMPWLVCEHRGAVIGYAYASPHRARPAYQWSVEVSAYVHADVQRAGVGRALYASLFAILVLQGFRNAFAGITLPNPASVGLHEAVRFTPIGVYHGIGYKLGAWHDVGWFERPLAPRDADPLPPRPLAELRADPAVADALGTALEAGLPLLRLT